jgi:2-aminoadipate transaminase
MDIATMAAPLLNRRARMARSSAIRDLLDRSRVPGMISLAGGIPDPGHFPLALLADLASGVIGDDGRTSLQYGATAGEVETRLALTGLFGSTPSGPALGPDDLVVTSGAQQALDLVARVLIDPGDRVVCGDPDYLGFLGVLDDHRATPHPVPIDAGGLDTERLERDLRAGLRPRACYVVPHHHNPTGVTIDPDRRNHLHLLSSHYGFVVIEDDPYRELHFDGRRPVEADADPALTVRIRSTSKILSPGLRIGALAGPPEVTRAVVIQKQSADLHTSTLAQAIVVAALRADFLPFHLDDVRAAYRSRLDTLLAALDAALGDRGRVDRPSGGMFVWLSVPGVDTAAWLDRALERNVCFVPGAAFAVEVDLSDRARLGFVTASEAQIVEGVDRLAATLPAPTRTPTPGPSPARPARHQVSM